MMVKKSTRALAAVMTYLACIPNAPATGVGRTHTETVKGWTFDRAGDREGWVVPNNARGAAQGGVLWITLTDLEGDVMKRILKSEKKEPELLSPDGLDIPASSASQIRLKILNLSPATDFIVQWRTKETNWGPENWREGRFFNGMMDLPPQSRRCALKGDFKEWQEITCFIDDRWQGTIEQIAIQFRPAHINRGDIWIDRLEIVAGTREPDKLRPDIASANVIPRISISGLSQAGFENAFKVLDEALVTDIPIYGFTQPVISPGGYYRDGGWWLTDSSLSLAAAKWTNEGFAENVMRGFVDVQASNPDGHMDGGGRDWPDRGSISNFSALPRFFEIAYDIARRTNDQSLRTEIYTMTRKYLDWWLSPIKRDGKTGLVSSDAGDETFGEVDCSSSYKTSLKPQTVAAVDTNVAVAIGALRVYEMSQSLGRVNESRKYWDAYQDMRTSINKYLWNEGDGVYYNYDLINGTQRKRLLVSIFDPLRLAISSTAQKDRLLTRLLDPTQFNWGKIPLTSVAMIDPAFVEWRGDYNGPAWVGDVWTLRNMMVVKGLEDSGRPDLAAELNWATIKTFHDNYWEFVVPSSGQGQGAKRFSWTASQYVDAIIEHLFGVDFDRSRKQLRIEPHVPRELYGQDIALEHLNLPTDGGARLSIHIKQFSQTAATIRVMISGRLPKGDLLVVLPGTAKKDRVSMRRSFTANFQ
jgi:hypothetical protein